MSTTADGYAGDVTAKEAYDLAKDGAALVDCRTQAEWAYVGVPDLSPAGAEAVGIEWLSYPSGQVNPQFLDQLRTAVGAPGEQQVLFLCRSGVRSVAAAKAAAAAGYTRAYNILDGFEGGLDEHGHRGVTGWRAEGLPWRQG